MKSMCTLFFVLVFMIMAQSRPTTADAGCTEVTVNYTGNKNDWPSSVDYQRFITAWHITPCNKATEEYYVRFAPPNQTISFQQKIDPKTKKPTQRLQVARPVDTHYPIDILLEGDKITINCKCSQSVCQCDQPIVTKNKNAPQKSKSL